MGVGLALLSTAIGLLLISFSSARRPLLRVTAGAAPVDGSAARDLLDIRSHNSPSLARNPRDLTNLVVANRVDTPRFGCSLHASFDSGITWSESPIPLPEGEEPKCFAPDVAFAVDGTLRIAFVTLAGAGNTPHAVWLTTSTDGGVTLAPARRVLGPLAFQVSLVADPDQAERVYLSWLQAAEIGTLSFATTANPVNVARSDDGGVTWSDPVRVSPPARQRPLAPTMAAGHDGRLFVAYLDLGDDSLDYHGGHQGRGGEPYGGAWQLVVARSTDGGRRWTESVAEAEMVPTQRFIPFIPPVPALAVDHEGLYVAYPHGADADADVWVWRSPDGRGRWHATRANDTAIGDGTTQNLPALSISPGGRLDLAYLDRRADPSDVQAEVSLQSSFDAGATFGPRLSVSGRSFDSTIGAGSERGLPDLGSSLGLLSTDAEAVVVWPDTRAGTQASNKQDLARAIVAVTKPPLGALAPWTGELRLLASTLAGAGVAVMVSGRRRSRVVAA